MLFLEMQIFSPKASDDAQWRGCTVGLSSSYLSAGSRLIPYDPPVAQSHVAFSEHSAERLRCWMRVSRLSHLPHLKIPNKSDANHHFPGSSHSSSTLLVAGNGQDSISTPPIARSTFHVCSTKALIPCFSRAPNQSWELRHPCSGTTSWLP
jgi:hypothetical protein